MAIYAIEIKGRSKRILVREKTAAKAVDLVLTAKALTTDQLQDALADGEKVWNPTDPFPADEPAQESDQGPGDEPQPDAQKSKAKAEE